MFDKFWSAYEKKKKKLLFLCYYATQWDSATIKKNYMYLICLSFVGELGFTAVEIQYEGDETTLATVSLWKWLHTDLRFLTPSVAPQSSELIKGEIFISEGEVELCFEKKNLLCEV